MSYEITRFETQDVADAIARLVDAVIDAQPDARLIRRELATGVCAIKFVYSARDKIYAVGLVRSDGTSEVLDTIFAAPDPEVGLSAVSQLAALRAQKFAA
jgi:hypothetical protein